MGKWTDIASMKIKEKAKLARELKKKGVPVAEIAKKLELSKSRIYEYLRGDFGQNWHSKK